MSNDRLNEMISAYDEMTEHRKLLDHEISKFDRLSKELKTCHEGIQHHNAEVQRLAQLVQQLSQGELNHDEQNAAEVAGAD